MLWEVSVILCYGKLVLCYVMEGWFLRWFDSNVPSNQRLLVNANQTKSSLYETASTMHKQCLRSTRVDYSAFEPLFHPQNIPTERFSHTGIPIKISFLRALAERQYLLFLYPEILLIDGNYLSYISRSVLEQISCLLLPLSCLYVILFPILTTL